MAGGSDTWHAVDDYFSGLLSPQDEALSGALAASEAGGLPSIAVSALQGRLLTLLAHVGGARRVLEVGTLGGYSTIHLARALPADGRVVTLELEPKHAAVARANLDRAGVGERVEIRVGAALASLEDMVAGKAAPFDLIFIDADKENIAAYFELCMKLSRVGTLLICDNVVRGGDVANAASTNAATVGTRRLIELMSGNPRLVATAVQTVGHKGYDGLAMAVVVG